MLPLPNLNQQPDASHMIAYLAGFFDGEGCIRLMANHAPERRGQSPVHRLVLIVTQRADRVLPLQLLQRTFGGTIGHGSHAKGNAGATLRWSIAGKPALNALQLMLPYLTVKRIAAYAGMAWAHWKDIMQEFRQGQRLSDDEIRASEEMTEIFRMINGRAVPVVTKVQ